MSDTGEPRRAGRESRLERRLRDPLPIVLDGAMGSQLHERGVPTRLPLWSAHALLERPDVTRAVHADNAAAGAEVITANTFRTNPRTLARCGLHKQQEELTALAEGVRLLARQGAVRLVVTPSFLDTAAREGLRAREYRASPGDRVACTVTAEDDLLVSRLAADFAGVARVDLLVRSHGQAEQRIEDVPVDPGASELLVSQSLPEVRPLEHDILRMRLVAREAGGERLLGEYTFEHTATRHD